MGTFSGDPDALVHLAGLGVDAFVPAQARWARAFGLDVSATARLDLDYTEGVLTPALAIDDTDIVATATYLEPFPSAEAALESSFPGLMAVALESFLGADLLPALPIPAVQGLTLADLRFFAEGEGQWLGAYAGLDSSGAVPIEVDLATACAGGGCDAGCGGDGGCGAGCDEGCAGTCDQARRHPAPAGGVLAMGSGLLTGLAVRRRRGR